RYLPDFTSRNVHLSGCALRTAMNTPILRCAVDIIKLSMVTFTLKMKETTYHSKLLLQLHDQLISSVPISAVYS
ncbi:DNA polymerase, partial [Staphylococcus aureus]